MDCTSRRMRSIKLHSSTGGSGTPNEGAIDDVAESDAVADDGHASDGAQQRHVVVGHRVGAANEHAAGPVDHAALARRAHDRKDLIVQILRVRVTLVVDDHEIRRDSLHAPILVRDEQLVHAWQPHRVGDRGQHDRPIAGNALTPQRTLPSPILGARLRRRAQLLVRVEKCAGEHLVERRVRGRHVEAAKLHLRRGPRQRECAIGSAEIAIAVGDVARFIAAVGDERRERDAPSASRAKTKSNAQRR